MENVAAKIAEGLSNALLMAWEVWWALVLGFAISAVVQAWVPRERIVRTLGGSGVRPVALATGLGAASSSCSYAAVAIAKSLFQKGASVASALAFQFASTNLVVELGAVIWLLIGWRFALAELVGGLLMVVVMTSLLRLFVSRTLEARARAHAQAAETGHEHHTAGGGDDDGWRARVTSVEAWSDVAHNFRNDVAMLWKELTVGFLLAGFIGLLGNGFFRGLFVAGAPGPVRALENVVVGPIIAVLSFVCSVGNVPLAAVLWSGGIGFGGVLAFIFADLIVLPLVAVYRKYYGTELAVRITLLMFTTMVVAALAVDGLFSVLGLVPSAHPSRGMIFEPVGLDYKLVANVLAGVVFAALFGLTVRRGATDPICGMRVDRAQAVRVRGRSGVVYLCSAGCAARFAASEEAEGRHGEETGSPHGGEPGSPHGGETGSLEPPPASSSSSAGARAALPR
jgi:uncharacterized membrane protein YraQ (UPF0718 family)/YHS domain-containing protein